MFGIAHIYASFNDTFVVRNLDAQYSLSPDQRAVAVGIISWSARPVFSLSFQSAFISAAQIFRCTHSSSSTPFAFSLFSSFQHVTDVSGRETICKVTGGMKVKADRDESSPYAAMLAAQDVAAKIKQRGITALHIRIRATGGTRTKTPGPGAQSALRALARAGIKIGRIGAFPWRGIQLLAMCTSSNLFSNFVSRGRLLEQTLVFLFLITTRIMVLNVVFSLSSFPPVRILFHHPEDTTPIPTDATRRKGGRRGRRL